MKMRIALLSLLTILCVSLAALPAVAAPQLLYTTGGPQRPSPVGTGINNGIVTDVSWNCAYQDCDVTGATFWTFDTVTGQPTDGTQVSWLLSGHTPFNFKGGVGGTSPVFQIGECVGFWCLDSVSFGRSIDVPGGLNWLNLYSFVGNSTGHVIAWSNSDGTGMPSATLLLGPTGGITGYPSSLAFSVYGTPTVPEPGSILMLGTGILGLAGVLRRKLRL